MSIVVVSGTNRIGSNTRVIASDAFNRMKDMFPQQAFTFLDLAELKTDLFEADAYNEKPSWFLSEFQTPITEAEGVLAVLPEYNGSFPGVLKYFIDMLDFPSSLSGVPCAFIGVAAGQFGALRSVEQIELIFHYRLAHIFGKRLFVPKVHERVSDGEFVPGEIEEFYTALLKEFVPFCLANKIQA